MLKTFILLMSIMLGGLSGCFEEQLDDVSKDPKFNQIVGLRYKVVGAVDGYGIRKHSKAEIDYITLIPPPGIQGVQIAFRTPIKVGSTITVLKIFRTNRFFDPNMSIVIQLEGTQMPIDKIIRVDLFRGNEGQGLGQLNPSIYRQLSTANNLPGTP